MIEFNFKNFLESDWLKWKNKILREAEEETAAKFPGGNATLRQPILFDEDDWRFLSQFPPQLWTRALNWRYGDGLLSASEARERSRDKKYASVPNKQDVEIEDNNGKKYIFRGIYAGLRDLMRKLERPVITHAGYKPNKDEIPYEIEDVEGPSLDELDFDAPDEKTVRPDHKHPSEYKGGVYDMDLTKPIKLSQAFVDSLPSNHYLLTNIEPMSEEDPKAEKKARAKLMKMYAHSFASMPAMREEVAREQLQNWIRLMGLGLLGNVPKAMTDHSGKSLEVQGRTNGLNPSEFVSAWPGQVGREDDVKWEDPEGGMVKARQIPLKLPYVRRNITWWEVSGDKEPVQKGGEFALPVLLPGKLMPLINPTAEQREALIKRRSEGGKGGGTGQVGELRQVLDNWDLMSPDQQAKLEDDSLTLTQLAARKMAPGYKDKFGGEEKRRGEDFYTGGGWHAQKGQRTRGSLNMTKDQLELVLREYLPGNSTKLTIPHGSWDNEVCAGQNGFMGEACRGVTYFMRSKLKWKGHESKSRSGKPGKFDMAQGSVLKMMEAAYPEIINVAAALLSLEANDGKIGIYAPEDGLNENRPELGTEEGKYNASMHRMGKAFNLARDLAQAAMYGGQSRRQRGKGKGFELTGQGGEQEGPQFGDDIRAPSLKDKEDIEARRARFAQDGQTAQPRTWYAYRQDVATRPQWLVPTLTPELSKYLETLRQEIKSRVDGVAGTNYANNITKIADLAMMIDDTSNKMIEVELKKLEDRGVLDLKKDDSSRVKELLSSAIKPGELEEKLRQDYPDAFGKMTEKRIQELIGSRKGNEGIGSPEDADVVSKQSTAMPEQIERIIDALADSGYIEKFDLSGTNINKFLKPLFAGRPGTPYGVYLGDNKMTDDMEFLGVQRNQELPGDEPEVAAITDNPLSPDEVGQKLSGEFKSVQNLFALMGFSKQEAAKYVPQFLQAVYKIDANEAQRQAQGMGYPVSGVTVPSTAIPSAGVPATPMGMAASVVDTIGQWILSDENDTKANVSKKLKEILQSGQMTANDLKPFYSQLYKKVQGKLSTGQQPTDKDYILIQLLGHLAGQ